MSVPVYISRRFQSVFLNEILIYRKKASSILAETSHNIIELIYVNYEGIICDIFGFIPWQGCQFIALPKMAVTSLIIGHFYTDFAQLRV